MNLACIRRAQRVAEHAHVDTASAEQCGERLDEEVVASPNAGNEVSPPRMGRIV